jgi:hypothetical protein
LVLCITLTSHPTAISPYKDGHKIWVRSEGNWSNEIGQIFFFRFFSPKGHLKYFDWGGGELAPRMAASAARLTMVAIEASAATCAATAGLCT